MKNNRLSCALATVFAATAFPAGAEFLDGAAVVLTPGQTVLVTNAKAISTQTLGSRGTVTPSATLFGGFEIRAQADIYVLVRGNSLGTLNITQGFLDAPRLRLFDSTAHDLVIDGSGRGGTNACVAGSIFTDPVLDFYNNVRHIAVHARDACVAVNLPAGAYTFTVTPSIVGVTTTTGSSSPSSGEVLFEVTMNP